MTGPGEPGGAGDGPREHRDDFAELEHGATDVSQPAVAAGPVVAVFALTVIEGTSSGASFLVDAAQPEPTLLGQGPACDARIDDRTVSRRHAELYAEQGRLRVRDLGSTNGTFVDGVRIVEALLSGGETIRVGATALRVDRTTVAAAPTTPAAEGFGRFVGKSPEMLRLYPLVERLARSPVAVIIEGETGTGKEVLAEAIHDASPRAAGPFVVFDCTAVPASLMEGELFGHERGAFTGALTSRRGVFEQAHGGTLLIDEIGDLDLTLQPKLLRAIERSEIRRIGAERSVRVDVRILAATRRDLDREVAAGRFRDDLFHRLAVGRIELPPLRRRRGDVALLAEWFWRELGGAGAPPRALVDRWAEDAWPGNTRELRNAVARQLALGDLVVLQAQDEPDAASAAPSVVLAAGAGETPIAADLVAQLLAEKLPLPVARLKLVQGFEDRYLAQVLAEHGGNAARAAAASGIGRRYFNVLRSRQKRR